MGEGAAHSFAGDVLRQFEHAWDMFGEAISQFSLDQWRRDEGAVLAPARVAYHVLETASYYFSPTPAGVANVRVTCSDAAVRAWST